MREGDPQEQASFQVHAATSVHKKITRSGVARSNKFSFTGQLAAGTYELTRDPGGRQAETVTFKVTG